MKLLAFVLALTLFFSCKKEDGASSSEKSISAVVFKSSDNPMLAADVSGTVNQDTIKFSFPLGISISHLVPTITFVGSTIAPANKTAQDFTGPVTYTITAQNGTTRSYLLTVQADSITAISAKWHLVEDSLYDDPNYWTSSGEHPIPGAYFGTASDYYEFTTNGTLNLHENGISGSTTYQILSNNKLSVNAWEVNYGKGTIETLTSNIAIFSWQMTTDYGARLYRRVALSK